LNLIATRAGKCVVPRGRKYGDINADMPFEQWTEYELK
jgi:hypothetical protein